MRISNISTKNKLILPTKVISNETLAPISSLLQIAYVYDIQYIFIIDFQMK